jgi:hypothetical protein
MTGPGLRTPTTEKPNVKTPRTPALATLAAVLVLALAPARPARAGNLITNGGFESGFAGWTIADQVGSDGTFALQSGAASPVNLDPVPPPPGGTTAAMTDALGPGTHVLYQDFVVPTGPLAPAVLSFDLFIGNRADEFFTPDPATLDFSSQLNQQARVDILLPGADPFSVDPADVLLNVYQTQPGDPAVSGYTTISMDVSALLLANVGNTLRLRFAEADNVFTFQLGVDNVRLATAVPEPSTLLGALLGGFATAGILIRRKQARISGR